MINEITRAFEPIYCKNESQYNLKTYFVMGFIFGVTAKHIFELYREIHKDKLQKCRQYVSRNAQLFVTITRHVMSQFLKW